MAKIKIFPYTTKEPISMIGEMAGICYGSDTTDPKKNYKRGLDCLSTGHGRTFEFPDVYLSLDEASARVMREWYTHIGGSPTRLQASTRYINYVEGFEYFTPPSIKSNQAAKEIYDNLMQDIMTAGARLSELGIPNEDVSNILPLGMDSTMVAKYNLRTLMDMSHQRLCARAYHEYRATFHLLMEELRAYSSEWAYLVDNYFKPKCDLIGYCTEKKSCGRHPKFEDNQNI